MKKPTLLATACIIPVADHIALRAVIRTLLARTYMNLQLVLLGAHIPNHEAVPADRVSYNDTQLGYSKQESEQLT